MPKIVLLQDYLIGHNQENNFNLSSIEILQNGNTADLMVWFDWLEAVKHVLEEEKK